jgi:hypothetical protein
MEQLINFFKETGIIWVALFGFAGTILAPLLSPWIESRREKRKFDRENKVEMAMPYTQAFAALTEAIAETDTSHFYIMRGSGRPKEGVPTAATKSLARALAMCPLVDKDVAESIKSCANAIRDYAEYVANPPDGAGHGDAGRKNAMGQLDVVESLIRKVLG